MGQFADLTDDGYAAASAPMAVRFGAQASPDKAAEAMALARRYKLPPLVAEQFAEDYKARALTEDSRAVFDKAPRLGSWIAEEPQRAKVAHDDLDTLGGIDQALRALKNIPRAVASAFPQAGAGLYGAAAAPFELAGQGFRFAEDALADMMGAPRGMGRNVGEAVGGFLLNEQRAAQAVSAGIYTAPEDAGIIERGVGSGFQSATQTLLTLPLALRQGGQNAALGILGTITGGQSYGKAREKGVAPAGAAVYGVEDAVAEVVTERLPFGKLLGDIKAGTSGGRMLVNNLVREVPGEIAATLWQNFNEWLNVNPDKSVGDWLDEQPAALGETIVATLVGGGAQVGAIKAAQAGLDRISGQAKQAEQDAAGIENLSKLAEASKLRARDAESFREFVAQVAEETGDAPAEFYIDGATLANSLNQSGMTMQELEAVAPVVASQLSNAATGGDIRVPVSEFLAAGEAITTPLIDHLRASPDAMSRAEAQEYIKTEGDRIQQEVEEQLQRSVDRDGFQQSIDAVRAEFEGELTKAKRFTADVNRAYSDLLANFYGATAARLGMTPQELLQKYRVRVQGQMDGGARTLEQAPKTPEFRNWFGDSKVVDAKGEPLVVYHGTNDKFTKVNFKKGAQGLFWFTSDKGSIESGDAGAQGSKNIMELFAKIENPAGWKEYDKYSTGELQARGYDGVILPEADGSFTGFIFKDAAQVKSATKNRGTFNPNDANILNQDETPRAQISLPQSFEAGPAVISLLAGADLSSFLHESGHLFLEVQSDLATKIQQQIDSGASVTDLERGIVADMNRLLEWFGVKGNESLTPLQEWGQMSLDEKRAHHEQFARGFEAYAFEGNAPSLELQSIFQRFRSWLMQVYKTLRNLNVELNDDVRAVMGRMLASDFAIEEAEAARNMGPLFKDAESAGMTLDEFNAYQELARGATARAIDALATRGMKDMQWLSRAKDKALKARQQEVDELRREVRQEVRSEVYQEPVYRAWQWLTSKEDGGKLRTEELREMYGVGEDATWRKLSALRMTSDATGVSPESVAEDFGFDSGDALVKALAEAMPPAEVIEARTDQRMLEMFGDITSPEALERAADEAVHNEARSRFIASELKALQEANTVREDAGKRTKQGRKSTVDVMARAAKDYAQQIIARLKVRELRPAQYAAAEARNAKLAEKAFAGGKTDEAAMHKRNQLVNNYAAKAAYDAQAEVKQIAAYFRRFEKRSPSVDPGYLDQIDGMLERFDFKPVSLREVDRRKSLKAWYDDQVESGNVPAISDELLDEANRKSYKDMTLEELRGLRDAVKNIEHLGRLKNRLLLARDKRTFDAAATEIANTIRENGGEAREVQLEGEKGFRYWLEGIAAMHRKLSSYFRQMDGGRDDGPLYELIGRAMNERGAWEDTQIEQATVKLSALYAPLTKMRGGITGARSKQFIPAINASLTRGGRLAVALNWGNLDNRQRIMDGDKWSEAQARAVISTLTAEELAFVNGAWEFLDSYWPEIAAKEKRLTGVEPEKVKAEPFTVKSSDGIDVAMRGGYYPLKYDTDRSDRAESQEAAQAAKEMMRGALTRATTRRGHTKERLQEVKRAVRKDLNVITQHVTQVVHDLAWHEWLIDTNRFLRDDRVVDAIREHYGPKVLKTIRDDVAGIATADVVPQTDLDKALLLLRSNVSRATMGASITTAFLQPFGLTQSMARIGSKHVLRGAARWAGDAARMENTLAWIQGKSEFMRLRAKSFNRELREIHGTVAGKSAAMRAVDGGLFWLMQKMQLVADVPTWIGQYEKSRADGLDEDAAVAQADRAVIESQGSGQIKDMAEVQRKHPMLTQFYSYFSVTLNLVAEKTATTDFKNPRAVAGWLGDMALLLAIPAIVPQLLMHLLRGGEDDEDDLAKRIAKWQLGYLMGMVVGLREGSGAIEGFDYAGPPVGRIVSDIGKAGKQTAQGEVDEPAVLAYARLMGTAFGIPVVQAIRSYKGWKAWDEGEAGPQAILFGPPPKP